MSKKVEIIETDPNTGRIKKIESGEKIKEIKSCKSCDCKDPHRRGRGLTKLNLK